MIIKNRAAILYGIALALLLFLLKWLQLHFVVINHAVEIYTGAIAIVFTALGGWLAVKLSRPRVKTIVVEKEKLVISPVDFVLNRAELEKTGISKRELEVLQLMAEGLSNNEIAERLCVSLNTIKTHTSKLFDKIGVERRTQAVDKAKKLGLIP